MGLKSNFRFHKKNFVKSDPKLSEYISWLRIDESGIVYNKDDSMQLTFKFRGPDLDSSTIEELQSYHAAINNIIKSASTGYVFYMENQRHASEVYDKADFQSPLTKVIETEREKFFNSGKQFENDYFFTILYHPNFNMTKKFLSFFESKEETTKKQNQYWKEIAKATSEFIEETNKMLDMFNDIFLDVKVLSPDETLEYLHSTVSDHRQPIKNIPTMYLSSYLLDSPLVGGFEPKLGDKHMRVISVTSFPPITHPGFFDILNRLGFEYRWSSRYHALSKMDAMQVLKDIEDNFRQQAKTILQYAIEAIRNKETNQVNESMLNYAEEAKIAQQLLETDAVGYGYYTMTLVVLDKDPEMADKKAAFALKEIRQEGFTAQLETTNAIDAYFGSIPGMWEYNVRKYLMASLNFSHLAPTSAVWSGEKKNSHLKGPVLLHTVTTGSTPFRLSLHVGDVGHTFVVGPTGSGKSVLLNMIETHFTKYPGARVFIFDVGSSSRAVTKAMGGNFYNIMGDDNPLAFQPLSRIDEDIEFIWANDWIINYLTMENVPIDPIVKTTIHEALKSLREMEPSLRTLTSFQRLVQNHAIRQALAPLCEGGTYGGLFDNSTDKFGEGNWQVFEMDEIMKMPNIVPSVLDFLFHRIEGQLREDGAPGLIILDECWLFFANPIFQSKIRKYFKDLRKKNTSIIFATQNLSDISASPELANTVRENCPTQIYLPNPKATAEGIKQQYINFGLNSRQIELLSELTQKREYYVSSIKGNRVFDLALQPLEAAFVTATSKEDQLKIQALEKNHLSKDEFILAWLDYKDMPEEKAKYQSLIEPERSYHVG